MKNKGFQWQLSSLLNITKELKTRTGTVNLCKLLKAL